MRRKRDAPRGSAPYDGRMGTACVTGATSGLGTEFCWQLAAAGHDLILVARRERELNELAEQLRQIAGVQAEVLVADLGNREQLERVCARLESDEAPVGLLVNNAGYALGEAFVDNSLDAECAALDVMVCAPMILAHYATRAMRDRGRGAVLNVASLAAETGAGTYSAHKAWIRAFTEGLSEELRGTGVTVTAVCPGPVHTNFFDAAGVDMSDAPQWLWAQPEQVVSDALDAVRWGRVLVVPTLPAKVAMAAMRVMPRWLTRRVMRSVPHM